MPPILEIYVVWHPSDRSGVAIAEGLVAHFHGPAFAGLVGGAVEVYLRSEGWEAPGEPPRPLPFATPLPHGLPAPTLTAVVPLLGSALARAVQDGAAWSDYLGTLADSNRLADVGVFPLVIDREGVDGTALGQLLGGIQPLQAAGATDAARLAGDLAHSITGLAKGGVDQRLQVFLSHTKWHSVAERPEVEGRPDEVAALVEDIREAINGTHLDVFFDAASLQPGSDWHERLVAEAGRSALLVVRSDRYAEREWCQREVLVAKRADLPMVTLLAVRSGEDRGSFLLDHGPTVALDDRDGQTRLDSISAALHCLVDEALKRALWDRQRAVLAHRGFDWLPVHAPEPTTVIHWLQSQQAARPADGAPLVILHPDPPLGPDEHTVVADLIHLVDPAALVDILTPRTFANRGGVLAP